MESEAKSQCEPPNFYSRERVGIVVIGRNEGLRLEKCLDSLKMAASTIIYVDSGSTDSSIHNAHLRGCHVIELDMRQPFTAARARNAGFHQLRQIDPHLEFVQFVDGDCILDANWLDLAARFLVGNPNIAVVAGTVREQFPHASIYNMLCDVEWEGPPGKASSCGGIAMMRADAFIQVHGFNVKLICGEEPELCSRMRTNGWLIWRLPVNMAEHDAAMTMFHQWWSRTLRAGFGYAQAADTSRNGLDPRGVRESRSAWMWALCLPLIITIMSILFSKYFLLISLIYPFQIMRLTLRGTRNNVENFIRAFFLIMGKFPEMLGQAKFCIRN